MLSSTDHEIFPVHKCGNANSCWHFNIYEQEIVGISTMIRLLVMEQFDSVFTLFVIPSALFSMIYRFVKPVCFVFRKFFVITLGVPIFIFLTLSVYFYCVLCK